MDRWIDGWRKIGCHKNLRTNCPKGCHSTPWNVIVVVWRENGFRLLLSRQKIRVAHCSRGRISSTANNSRGDDVPVVVALSLFLSLPYYRRLVVLQNHLVVLVKVTVPLVRSWILPAREQKCQQCQHYQKQKQKQKHTSTSTRPIFGTAAAVDDWMGLPTR